ncbi:hypothetical protein [Ramlibacter sp. WS9]|uniref:hypothetical protein n=1 Tax=Ramlibacter sp. WS9 TaxID=1882741 RepID=UPI0011418E3D|nr:hypothetical protein [Ramlibacter sp. WS9]ROZ75346.1 hypothetical protein EEB15_15405 [Ramlibacter sp. WS9]
MFKLVLARLALVGTVAAIALASTGCATYNNGTIVRDGPGAEFSASELNTFRKNQDAVLVELMELAQVPGVGADAPPNWDAVIAAGMDYADGKCEAYMHALFRLNRDRKTTTAQIGLLGAATAGILAAVEAAAKDVAITAIAFGLASATVDNLSGSLLYNLDPSSVRSLVKGQQSKYREVQEKGYSSRPAAMRVIRGYAALCLPANIEAEVNIAVKNVEPVGNPGDAATGQPPVVSNSETIAGRFTVKADKNTVTLRDFVFPGGTLNAANRKQLEDFLRGRGINVDVSSFMRLQRFAAERAEAVSALKLPK